MPEKTSVDRNQKLIKTLASGAMWITVGMILSRILGFGMRSAIAHFYGVENYGFINTAQSLMMIFAIIALAGLNTGLPRQISFFRARNENETARIQVFSAFKIGSVLGLAAGFILFFLADIMATRIFRTPALGIYIKIFSLGVPLFVLLELNTSIFKGLKQMFRFTFYHDIFRFIIILVLILILGILEAPFHLVTASFPISYLIIVIITIYLLFTQSDLLKKDTFVFNKTDRKLLAFSLPLMLSGIFWIVLPRTDTILIGGFLDQEQVGLYNAAVPIGQLILVIRQAFSPIILPLFTELIAQKRNEELSLLYYISAKWTMIFALPLFISMFILPKFFIWAVFGKEFLVAAPILKIVIIGFFIHTVVGPTSNLLIITGKTRLAMINSFAAFAVSISLNLLLIPKFQLLGAAISSVISYFVFNLLSFIQVYRLLKVQPFRFLHLKFFLAGLIPIPILLTGPIMQSDALTIIIYGLCYLLMLLLLRAYKSEDKIIFQAALNRFKK